MHCPTCYGRTSTPGRCPQCRAEHVATTAGHVDDDAHACAWCSRSSPEGRYVQTGMWLCDSCVRERIAAETTDALAGAVQWAVGGDEPECDPAQMEAGFEPASTRAIADGGPDLQEWAFELITEQVADEGEEPQDKSLWTSKGRLKAEASKVDFVERGEVAGLVDGLEARGEIVYWHGLIAPATEEHISELIASEVEAEYPRSILIGRLNTAKQSAEERLLADGGRPSEEDMLDVELVLGAGRPAEKQVRIDVASEKVVDREDGRLEISLSDGGVDEYLAELGLKHTTDEFAGGEA